MSLDLSAGSRHLGQFQIGEHLIPGEIAIEASRLRLKLHQPEFFFLETQPHLAIHGRLANLTHVSLLHCTRAILGLPVMRGDEQHHVAEADPQYALFGGSRITPGDQVVRAVRLRLSDAAMIFNDSGAFGLVYDPRPEDLADLIAGSSTLAGIEVDLGERPMVAYYTGKAEVFAVETVLGRISAGHNVSFGIGSAEGVGFNNQVWVRIAFTEPARFDEAVDASLSVLRFLAIIAGRKQTVVAMKLETFADGKADRFDVYWPLRPRRQVQDKDRTLHPRELVLDAAGHPVAFGAVLARWLDLDKARIQARAQFASCFDQENRYDVIRLIGAVNMFDLLPSEVGPDEVAIEPALVAARNQARGLFRALADSPERSSVLSALGRIGKPVLKRRIRHRARAVTEALAKPFPHLDAVIDIAVEARNLFVHGGASELDFSGPLSASLPFLTDLMEFLFAASDLIDCGWDARAWEQGNLTWDHPMGHVVLGYDGYLQNLEEALPASRKLGVGR